MRRSGRRSCAGLLIIRLQRKIQRLCVAHMDGFPHGKLQACSVNAGWGIRHGDTGHKEFARAQIVFPHFNGGKSSPALLASIRKRFGIRRALSCTFHQIFRLQGINNAVVIGEGTPSGIGVIWPEHGGSLVRVVNLGGIRQPLRINFRPSMVGPDWQPQPSLFFCFVI